MAIFNMIRHRGEEEEVKVYWLAGEMEATCGKKVSVCMYVCMYVCK